MPTHDAPEHPLALILKKAFASQLDSGEVDLVMLDGAQDFEMQADEWTLHLEGWPVTMAFIALDDEPASLTERRNALDAALDNQHIVGIRRANALLDGAIVAALEDSGDELSLVLAQVVALPESDADFEDEDA